MVDQGCTPFGYMMMQMVVAHAGRCAERVVLGDDITDGGPSMIYKRSQRVGLANRADSTDRELVKYRLDDPHVIPADMIVEVLELFTHELKNLQ
ncbi:hypothetical protein L1987_57669 [Smallanthus sonchifolius]|uniref:Uncharacterized protein n=1 Tax=Smallanthus sonchifolius TaxID=185202 RepID=A0ACB9DDH9_9ASTR|nr:hypothetical protein L1987_57669 [Smallanthus sonchifolius]